MFIYSFYTPFDGLAYNTRGYFASGVVFFTPFYAKVKVWIIYSGHFVAPLSVRIFALLYSILLAYILRVLLT